MKTAEEELDLIRKIAINTIVIGFGLILLASLIVCIIGFFAVVLHINII